MSIVLFAVTSPDVTLDVVPAVLPEAPGGIALRFELYEGPICFTLTAEEPGWLSEQIARQLTEGADPTGGARPQGWSTRCGRTVAPVGRAVAHRRCASDGTTGSIPNARSSRSSSSGRSLALR
jgi:hypothetical protein